MTALETYALIHGAIGRWVSGAFDGLDIDAAYARELIALADIMLELEAKMAATKAQDPLRARERGKPKWQPIETAPKDGTRFDVWIDCRGRVTDVHYYKTEFNELTIDSCDCLSWMPLDGVPSHWMPLPEPPEAAD